MRSLPVTLGLVAALFAAPALAGPIGSGLALTEQMARSGAQARKPVVRIAADVDCLRGVAGAVKDHPAVHKAKVARDHLQVSFHSPAAAQAESANVEALVAKACAGARIAGVGSSTF